MRRKIQLLAITVMLLLSIVSPLGAASEPLYGGMTAGQWQQIAELLAKHPPTYGGFTFSQWQQIATLLPPPPADPLPDQSFDPGVEQILVDAANEFGISAAGLGRLADCESSGDPRAQNTRSSASGLLQFIDSTWARYAPRLGYAIDRATQYLARPNARVAAMMISEGQIGQWSCGYAY
jgi:soluble lytic murein transglycosylase-like protein